MSVGIINGNVYGLFLVRATITPASVGAATSAEQTFSLPNVKVNDLVFINPPSTTAGTGVSGARITQADTVGITFSNSTAGSLTPAAGEYLFFIIRPESGRARTRVGN